MSNPLFQPPTPAQPWGTVAPPQVTPYQPQRVYLPLAPYQGYTQPQGYYVPGTQLAQTGGMIAEQMQPGPNIQGWGAQAPTYQVQAPSMATQAYTGWNPQSAAAPVYQGSPVTAGGWGPGGYGTAGQPSQVPQYVQERRAGEPGQSLDARRQYLMQVAEQRRQAGLGAYGQSAGGGALPPGYPDQQGTQQGQAQAQGKGAAPQNWFDRWQQEFQGEHGGASPSDWYKKQGEGLAEALGDREWSQRFAREQGRPPNQTEWEDHWYISRTGRPRPVFSPEQWKKLRSMMKGRRRSSGGGAEEEQRPPNYVPPMTIWRLGEGY